MGRTRIKAIGLLRYRDERGLEYSLPIGPIGKKGEQTIWLDPLPGTDNWPTLGKQPERPKRFETKAAEERWKRASDAYMQALHADPTYRAAAIEFLETQRREPILLFIVAPRMGFWAYHDK